MERTAEFLATSPIARTVRLPARVILKRTKEERDE